MPLIMEEELDMDDLFGEGSTMALPTPQMPKALTQRLEEARLSGCCQKIAWSRLGCIAYINKEGTEVVVRHLFCKPDDGRWTLSGPQSVTQAHSASDGQHLTHLSWNHIGSELAVVDALGRISVLSILIVMNRLAVTRSGHADQEDDLSAVTGLFWLNPERLSPLYRPTVKNDGQFQYSALSYKLLGPFHPHNMQTKSALICALRNGSVKLLFQQIDGRWTSSLAELESLSSSGHVISHASFCPDRDSTLLLVVRTTTSETRIFRISISWNIPPPDKAGARPQFISPSLIIRPLVISPATLHHSLPLPSKESSALDVRLTWLEIIPAVPRMQPGETPSPTLLTVRAQVPSMEDQHEQVVTSWIERWELRNSSQTLHESFPHLGAKQNGAGPAMQEELDMQPLEGFSVDQLVLSVQQLFSGTILAFAYSDGAVEFRDRTSMSLILADEDVNRVTSMPQVGFAFSRADSCLHVALSPNSCAALYLDLNHEARLKMMEAPLHQLKAPEVDRITPTLLTHSHRALNISADLVFETQQHDKLFRNTSIQRCLSLQNSLGYSGFSSTRPRNLGAKVAWSVLRLRFVALTLRFALNTAVKPGAAGAGSGGGESDFLKPEVLQSLFGVIRWSIDLMNYIIDSILELSTMIKTRPFELGTIQTAMDKQSSPALVLLLSSIPRTFLRYNTRALRGLQNASHKALHQQASRKAANPASATESDRSPGGGTEAHRQAFRRATELLDASPVGVGVFERFVGEVEGAVKQAYNIQSSNQSSASSVPKPPTLNNGATPAPQAQMTDHRRATQERDLLTSATLPPPLLPALTSLLTTGMTNMRREIDPAALYFSDFGLLGFDDNAHGTVANGTKRRRRWDEMRMMPLTLSSPTATNDAIGEWRRCTRCGAEMADGPPKSSTGNSGGNLSHPDGPATAAAAGGGGGAATQAAGGGTSGGSGANTTATNPWMASMQRTCFCGSLWMLVSTLDEVQDDLGGKTTDSGDEKRLVGVREGQEDLKTDGDRGSIAF